MWCAGNRGKTFSLPEVIGCDAALFDSRSDNAIAALMERALCDKAFRAELIHNSSVQAARFSWDVSARQAIAAFEQFYEGRQKQAATTLPLVRRPTMAYVSPLPPVRSGIADYSAELLPELARHYEIEVIVAQTEVSDAQVTACWPVRTVEWFVQHAHEYDRVLYHFGNSPFHQHMFDLLVASRSGCAARFLLHVLEHMESVGVASNALCHALYHSHGYSALKSRFHAPSHSDVLWKFPSNLGVLQNTHGVIVHSESSRRLARQWYGDFGSDDWSVIPLMRQPVKRLDRRTARAALGLKNDDLVVCSFGVMGRSKLNHRLLDAWLASKLPETGNCYLIFVGENNPDQYGNQILEKIRNCKFDSKIRITGWVNTNEFRQYPLLQILGCNCARIRVEKLLQQSLTA